MAEVRRKLLMFAHYYVPDTASTGQILEDLAEGMLREFDVTVVCAVPSYEGSVAPEYRTQKYYFENRNGVRLIRVRVPEFDKTRKFSRVANICVYFFRALRACRKAGPQDFVFALSQPPILGGLLGVLGKRQKRARLIYCIQDFNPEQIMRVGYGGNRLLLRLLMALDKFSCRRSDLVITVGRDLAETLRSRFSGRKVPRHTVINNWIDEEQIRPLPPEDPGVRAFKAEHGLENKFVFMYSGNIGLYYDLENMLKVIGRVPPGTRTPDGREAVFVFVGGGSLLPALKAEAEARSLTHVRFLPYREKEELIYSLNAADVHFCVNAKGIKGVSCPSKFYGIAAAGKPVLAVLEAGTEIRTVIEEAECGVVCEPGDYDGLERAIRGFIEAAGDPRVREMGRRGRRYLERHFTKDRSVTRYIEVIRECGEK